MLLQMFSRDRRTVPGMNELWNEGEEYDENTCRDDNAENRKALHTALR